MSAIRILDFHSCKPHLALLTVKLGSPRPLQSSLLVLASLCLGHDSDVLEQRTVHIEPHFDSQLRDQVSQHKAGRSPSSTNAHEYT